MQENAVLIYCAMVSSIPLGEAGLPSALSIAMASLRKSLQSGHSPVGITPGAKVLMKPLCNKLTTVGES